MKAGSSRRRRRTSSSPPRRRSGRSASSRSSSEAAAARRPYPVAELAGGLPLAPAFVGWLNDVRTVVTVLPYCDAIFIDNEVAGFLAEQPLRTRIDYGTVVFSPNRRERFGAYLDELRAAASEEHLQHVEDIYGADWAGRVGAARRLAPSSPPVVRGANICS